MCVPMAQGEVVGILAAQARIEPGFTGLVWQKLEEQNQEFFRYCGWGVLHVYWMGTAGGTACWRQE